jgi:hypothetical protein
LDDIPRPISRHNQCSICFNELHCCRLCRHYDSTKATTCHEDRADPPLQKENANFCEFFSPQPGAFEGKTMQKSASARDGLEDLFSATSAQPAASDDQLSDSDEEPSGEEPTRRKLDDLFR